MVQKHVIHLGHPISYACIKIFNQKLADLLYGGIEIKISI